MLLTAVAFLISCSEGRPPVKADDDKASHTLAAEVQSQVKATTASPGVSSAQKAYVDPDTGELIQRPAWSEPVESDSVRPSSLDASSETLHEQPSPVPGGGTMIDLKGHFQNPIKATVDGQGGTRIEHPADDKTE